MSTTTFQPWRTLLLNGLNPVQESLSLQYQDLRSTLGYSSWLIPGMLQTRAYTAAVFARFHRARNLSEGDVRAAIDSRMAHGEVMLQQPQRLRLLVEESVLRCGPGNPDVMRGQIAHLDQIIATGGLRLGLLPAAHGRQLWPQETFFVYDHAWVSIELVSGSLQLDNPDDVEEYVQEFEQLSGIALYGDDARDLLRSVERD